MWPRQIPFYNGDSVFMVVFTVIAIRDPAFIQDFVLCGVYLKKHIKDVSELLYSTICVTKWIIRRLKLNTMLMKIY